MNAISRLSLMFLTAALVFPGLLAAQDRQFSTQAVGGETPQAGISSGTASGARGGVQFRRVNGNQVINAREAKREIEIVVRPDGRISVNITRQYGPDELDRLLRREPTLEEYVKSFPRTAGDSDVELSIGLTSRFDAADEESLRDKDIAAFNLYRKYKQAARQSRSPFGRLPSVGDQRQIGPVLPDLENRADPKSDPSGGGNRGN